MFEDLTTTQDLYFFFRDPDNYGLLAEFSNREELDKILIDKTFFNIDWKMLYLNSTDQDVKQWVCSHIVAINCKYAINDYHEFRILHLNEDIKDLDDDALDSLMLKYSAHKKLKRFRINRSDEKQYWITKPNETPIEEI